MRKPLTRKQQYDKQFESITKPFYKEWWFYFLCFCGMVFLFFCGTLIQFKLQHNNVAGTEQALETLADVSSEIVTSSQEDSGNVTENNLSVLPVKIKSHTTIYNILLEEDIVVQESFETKLNEPGDDTDFAEQKTPHIDPPDITPSVTDNIHTPTEVPTQAPAETPIQAPIEPAQTPAEAPTETPHSSLNNPDVAHENIPSVETPIEEIELPTTNFGSYIGNKNTKKFHSIGCRYIDLMNEENKVDGNSRDDFILRGYDPCGHCDP